MLRLPRLHTTYRGTFHTTFAHIYFHRDFPVTTFGGRLPTFGLIFRTRSYSGGFLTYSVVLLWILGGISIGPWFWVRSGIIGRLGYTWFVAFCWPYQCCVDYRFVVLYFTDRFLDYILTL